jgi:PPP family 3-phenylpropionic acid transporter
LNGAYLLNRTTARGGISLLSQLTITRLDQLHRNDYSRVRIWGSVGWAFASIGSGLLLAVGSYQLVFAGSALMSLGILALVRSLPKQTNNVSPGETQAPAEPRRKGFYILAASQFLFFMGLSGVMSFIWVFVEQDLGVPVEHIGGYAAFFAIAELPPMLIMDRLIARMGVRKLLLIGTLGMAVIAALYSVIPAAPWLLLLQFLRGFFFSMFTICLPLMVARTSVKVNVATNQAIIQVTMPALAMLVSSPIAGWLYDNLGSGWMFRMSAVLEFAAALVLLVGYRHLTMHSTPEPEPVSTGD